jgi:hypothetical protein
MNYLELALMKRKRELAEKEAAGLSDSEVDQRLSSFDKEKEDVSRMDRQQALAGGLSGIGQMAGATGTEAGEVLSPTLTGASSGLLLGSAFGGGTAAGATSGSMAGPIGAAVGAALGLTAGLLGSSAKRRKEKKDKEAAARSQYYEKQMQTSSQLSQDQQSAFERLMNGYNGVF